MIDNFKKYVIEKDIPEEFLNSLGIDNIKIEVTYKSEMPKPGDLFVSPYWVKHDDEKVVEQIYRTGIATSIRIDENKEKFCTVYWSKTKEKEEYKSMLVVEAVHRNDQSIISKIPGNKKKDESVYIVGSGGIYSGTCRVVTTSEYNKMKKIKEEKSK